MFRERNCEQKRDNKRKTWSHDAKSRLPPSSLS